MAPPDSGDELNEQVRAINEWPPEGINRPVTLRQLPRYDSLNYESRKEEVWVLRDGLLRARRTITFRGRESEIRYIETGWTQDPSEISDENPPRVRFGAHTTGNRETKVTVLNDGLSEKRMVVEFVPPVQRDELCTLVVDWLWPGYWQKLIETGENSISFDFHSSAGRLDFLVYVDLRALPNGMPTMILEPALAGHPNDPVLIDQFLAWTWTLERGGARRYELRVIADSRASVEATAHIEEQRQASANITSPPVTNVTPPAATKATPPSATETPALTEPVSDERVPKKIWIPALGFTAFFVLFFCVVFFTQPALTFDQRNIVNFFMALTGGFGAFFFGGTATFGFDFPKNNGLKMAFSATGGIALFALLFLHPPYWQEGSLVRGRPDPAPITALALDAGTSGEDHIAPAKPSDTAGSLPANYPAGSHQGSPKHAVHGKPEKKRYLLNPQHAVETLGGIRITLTAITRSVSENHARFDFVLSAPGFVSEIHRNVGVGDRVTYRATQTVEFLFESASDDNTEANVLVIMTNG